MAGHAPTENMDALLEYIRQQRGVDFNSYKSASVGRRLKKRMHGVNVSTYAEYLDLLQASPDEFTPLLDTLFINVTGFFRDPDAWTVIRDAVIPRILETSGKDALRVWCAGVASGEECYSIAMLLAESMGSGEFRDRVKIYATDLDEETLLRARVGAYTVREIEAVPEELREKYFEQAADRYTFRSDLRRCIVFGRHNLLEDAPISRLDLLICRNTIMYFNREAQGRVLARFHFALRDRGFLFLGKAEMLLTRRSLFSPIDSRSRIFTKVLDVPLRDRLAILTNSDADAVNDGLLRHVHLRDMAYDLSPVPQVLIDVPGDLVLANEAARTTFGVTPRDLGKPFRDLDLSFRPVELRGPIHEVVTHRRPLTLPAVKRVDGGGVRFLQATISPVSDEGGMLLGACVSFIDVTEQQELRMQVEQSRSELETAYEELQSTNEELETTNEELQSTIEELETTNEELQSTNEELETMNEELQSTNEEIRAVNLELRERSDAVTRLNAYMRSILNSLKLGVVVLNEKLEVQLWNSRATDLWGLNEGEVTGGSFLNLDIGLPVAEVKDSMLRALRGETDFEALLLQAHNRRGKQLACRVTTEPLLGPEDSPAGVILLMEEWRGEASTKDAADA